MKPLRPALFALGLLLPVAQASELPALGDASSSIVSPQQEREMGQAWLGLLRSEVDLLHDPQMKDYVQTSVYRLAETSQVQDRQFTFILINSKELNAFAAPGGIIGVNGGLFLHAETESEYASVMAHELAHLSQRHFARNIETQQKMQVPLMAAMLAGIVAAAAGAGDAGMAAMASTQAAAEQAARRFSRDNEQEADRIGLVNLEKSGYDPRAMPAMFGRLMRQYRYDRLPPEFLLTHPVTENRIADTMNRASQAPPGGKEDSLRYQLIRARAMIQFQEAPGMAAKRFRAQLDESKGLEPARYGLAIAQMKLGQLNEARSLLDELLKQNPNEVLYQTAMVELDTLNNRAPDAIKRADAQLARMPRNYPLQQARINALLKQGQFKPAEQALEALLKERPRDPDIWYQVAEVRGQAGNIIGLHQARAEYFALMGDYPSAIEQLGIAKRKVVNNFPLAASIDNRQKELMREQEDVRRLMN